MTMLKRMILWAGFAVPFLVAQQATQLPSQQPPSGGGNVRPTYVLGPGDQITIRAFEVEEISDRPFRIDSNGDINLPIVGVVHAGGETVERLEADLVERLKTIVKNPQVVVNVVEFHSEPVFFQGAFVRPGIYALQGRRNLVEMLTTVGGLLPNASRRITVTRQQEFGPIPLPNTVVDPVTKVSTVEISMGSLAEGMSSPEDIVLQPYDRISVEKAELVYVNGAVNKVGGIELSQRDSISVTQVISMVGGITKDAAPEKARVLRPVLNTSKRAGIAIDVKKILLGQQADFPLLPNDVLYIPPRHRLGLNQVGLVAIPVVTSLVYVLTSKL